METVDNVLRYLVFLATWQPISVVAVVGMGHVPGIVANWNNYIDVGHLLMLVFRLFCFVSTVYKIGWLLRYHLFTLHLISGASLV